MGNVYDAGGTPTVADEREMLEAFLDFYRGAVVRKIAPVSEDDARRRLVPSLTTLGGLLKHLRRAEVSWFQHRLAQTPSEELEELRWLDDDPDGDFHLDPDETVDALVAGYEAACERSRATAARYELEHIIPHPRLGEVSLRWIYLHMLEETARHAGHADILREQIDGSVGD